jgi:hypothetical protein
LDDSIALVEFSKHGRRARVETVAYAHVEVGSKIRCPRRRLVVRFEDLLFDSEKTISTVCACVGGKMRPRFTQEEIVSKDKTLGHYGPVNDRAKALRLYSSEKHRFDHYDRDDLELLKAVAGRSHLFKAMGYDFDVDAALETQRRRRLLFGNATRGRRRR